MAGWNPTARPEALPKVGGPAGNPAGSPAGTPGGPGAVTEARGWAGKNRTTLLAAGAAGVVLLALVMKSRTGASATPDATAAGTYTTNPQNLAAYDSTSSDVYNALQPQLEAIQDLLNQWGVDKNNTSTTPVTSTPTTTPTTSTPVAVPVDPKTITYTGQNYAAYSAAYDAGLVPGAKMATAAEQAANRAAYQAALAKIKAGK